MLNVMNWIQDEVMHIYITAEAKGRIYFTASCGLKKVDKADSLSLYYLS